MLHYWNQPEETARCFHGDWFLTGDYARRDADGYVWFLGRKRRPHQHVRLSRLAVRGGARAEGSIPTSREVAAVGEEVGRGQDRRRGVRDRARRRATLTPDQRARVRARALWRRTRRRVSSISWTTSRGRATARCCVAASRARRRARHGDAERWRRRSDPHAPLMRRSSPGSCSRRHAATCAAGRGTLRRSVRTPTCSRSSSAWRAQSEPSFCHWDGFLVAEVDWHAGGRPLRVHDPRSRHATIATPAITARLEIGARLE